MSAEKIKELENLTKSLSKKLAAYKQDLRTNSDMDQVSAAFQSAAKDNIKKLMEIVKTID